jgi:hypothetical protein
MSHLLAFVDPDEDWIDIFMIIAAILAVIAAFLHGQVKAIPAVLRDLAIAAIALGLLFVS